MASRRTRRSRPSSSGCRTGTVRCRCSSISEDWSYRKFDQLYGTYTYLGLGVFGFKSTSAGAPLDSFGRNIYVDTLNSAYGTGLEAREQLPDAQPEGRVLLRVLRARSAPDRQGHRVPRHRRRPRRDAGRHVAGPGARCVRPGGGRDRERRHQGARRSELQAQLTDSAAARRPTGRPQLLTTFEQPCGIVPRVRRLGVIA